MNKKQEYTGADIHELVLGGEKTYEEIGQKFGTTGKAVESKYYRWKKKNVTKPTKEKAEFVTSGNYARAIVSESQRILTEDDLVKACKINLAVWKINRMTFNKHEVGAKDEHHDIKWSGGVMDGWSKKDGLKVTPLFKVEAICERIRPIPTEWPEVAPVIVHVKDVPYVEHIKIGLQLALIIPDLQVGFRKDQNSGILTPFHDRAAMDLLIQVARALQPSKIIFLGDNNDLPWWTDRFHRTPEFYFVTQPAIVELAWFYGQIRTVCPNAEIVVIEGNHDFRMKRKIAQNLIGAYGLRAADHMDSPPVLSLPYLLGLSGLGIEYLEDYPNGQAWINDGLNCSHGDTVSQGGGKTTAARVKSLVDFSECIGHIHRLEQAARTIYGRHGSRVVKSISLGTLCRTDGTVPGKKERVDWQQGFGIAHYDDECSDVTPISISNGRAIVLGEMFEGRDRVKQLRDDTRYLF